MTGRIAELGAEASIRLEAKIGALDATDGPHQRAGAERQGKNSAKWCHALLSQAGFVEPVPGEIPIGAAPSDTRSAISSLRAAGQHQIGEIGAGDEQQHSGCRQPSEF